MMPFVHEAIIDPIAAKLKRGEMPDTAGLVLVAAWGWGADSSSSYEALAKDMRALDPNTLHVYNGNYLHCTVATLSRCVFSIGCFYKYAPNLTKDIKGTCCKSLLVCIMIRKNFCRNELIPTENSKTRCQAWDVLKHPRYPFVQLVFCHPSK